MNTFTNKANGKSYKAIRPILNQVDADFNFAFDNQGGRFGRCLCCELFAVAYCESDADVEAVLNATPKVKTVYAVVDQTFEHENGVRSHIGTASLCEEHFKKHAVILF